MTTPNIPKYNMYVYTVGVSLIKNVMNPLY